MLLGDATMQLSDISSKHCFVDSSAEATCNRHCRASHGISRSRQHPLATALDKLVQQQAHVRQHETADVEPKELGRVPRAQLQPDLRLVGMTQPGILHLPRDLVCRIFISTTSQTRGVSDLPTACAASNKRASEPM